MNFNHLLDQKERLINCKDRNLATCKWKPVSEGQATAGRNVYLEMMCETCGSRTTSFMGFGEYEKHEKIIKEEVNNVKTSQ